MSPVLGAKGDEGGATKMIKSGGERKGKKIEGLLMQKVFDGGVEKENGKRMGKAWM